MIWFLICFIGTSVFACAAIMYGYKTVDCIVNKESWKSNAIISLIFAATAILLAEFFFKTKW
ncbi:MAG: hypothetical protein ACI4JG_07055 [Acutalibacteraceae bacterium]